MMHYGDPPATTMLHGGRSLTYMVEPIWGELHCAIMPSADANIWSAPISYEQAWLLGFSSVCLLLHFLWCWFCIQPQEEQRTWGILEFVLEE